MTTPDSVYEDIGYRRDMEHGDTYRIKKARLNEGKIKIEYIRGVWKGSIYWIRQDIAEDRIKHGWAVEVER